MVKTVLYEARFSIPAIVAGAEYGIPINANDASKYFPLNEWELLNKTTQQISVREDQNSSRDTPVDAGTGRRGKRNFGFSLRSGWRN